MVRIDGLEIQVGDFVLKVPQISFGSGDTVLVTGNNGSGKTVFFYALIGLAKGCTGSVSIGGFSNKEDGWQKQVGIYLDEYFLIPYFTPTEFFSFLGRIKGVPKDVLDKTVEEAKEDLEFDPTDRLIRDLSTGNRKKVGLISTLIGDPGLLVWDEPFASLDGKSKDGLLQIIHKLDGKTVLYSEPIASSLDLPYDRKLIIEKGELKETTLISGI